MNWVKVIVSLQVTSVRVLFYCVTFMNVAVYVLSVCLSGRPRWRGNPRSSAPSTTATRSASDHPLHLPTAPNPSSLLRHPDPRLSTCHQCSFISGGESSQLERLDLTQTRWMMNTQEYITRAFLSWNRKRKDSWSGFNPFSSNESLTTASLSQTAWEWLLFCYTDTVQSCGWSACPRMFRRSDINLYLDL